MIKYHFRIISSKSVLLLFLFLFFFNDTATTEIYTLSLHDALPISGGVTFDGADTTGHAPRRMLDAGDRKSTRLNSSHGSSAYAVFCSKKKNKRQNGQVKVRGAISLRKSMSCLYKG